MKQKWKKGLALIVAAALLGGVAAPFSQPLSAEAYAAADSVDEAASLQPNMYKNLNCQNYGVYGELVNSYLVALEKGFMRLQQVKDEGTKKIVIEYYDEQYRLQSQRYMDTQLKQLAGFYAGDGYYYIVWIQYLYPLCTGLWSEEDVFMRVVKYDKDWNELDSLDINSVEARGEGVVYPCDAGSLRMTEYQGHLYINTCMEGISTHQSSRLFDIIEEDMTLVKPEVNNAEYYYGGASHTFNQFLLIDKELEPKRMVTLHQCDNEIPGKRGAALQQAVLYTEYPEAVNSGNIKLVNAFPCVGNHKNNYVGISLGGLEQSETSYLIAGTSIDQVEETYMRAWQRNIFVTATSRTDFTKEHSSVTWLTDYKEGDGVTISTPQFVKMNNNLFLVMWRVGEQQDHREGELQYAFVDADGKRCLGDLGKTKSVVAEITDCKPIVKDGKAIWYSSNTEGVYFYTIDEQGNFERHGVNTTEEIPTLTKFEFREEGLYYEWEPVEHAAGYRIIRRRDTGTAVNDPMRYDYTIWDVDNQTFQYLDTSFYNDDNLYDMFVCALNEDGIPSYGSNMVSEWIYRGFRNSEVGLWNAADGVRVQWGTRYDASEYRIYRGSADGTDMKLIAKVDGRNVQDWLGKTESYVDTTAQSGVTYDYTVTAVRDGRESAMFNKHSIIYVPMPQVSAECTVKNGRNTVTLSWDAVPGAEKYSVSEEVWDEEAGKYKSITLGHSMGEDNLSCVIYGVEEGMKYNFKVRAFSKSIQTSSMQYKSPFLSEISQTELTYVRPEGAPPLPAPSIIGLNSTSEGVRLAWTSMEGVNEYELRIQGQQNTILLRDTAYTDTNVQDGKTYTYQVRICVQNGDDRIYSDWSEGKSITYEKPTQPQPPVVVLSATSFISMESTEEGVKMAWNPVEGADGYEINAYDRIQGSRTVIRGGTVCEDLRAADGMTYMYKVRAYVQKDGTRIYSDWSEWQSFTYEKPVVVPEIQLQSPVINTCENKREGVRLAWNPIDGADGYEINIRIKGAYKSDTIDLNDVVEYIDEKVGQWTAYEYRIRAYKRDGEKLYYSDWSKPESITFQKPVDVPALSAPKITSVKNTVDGVKITWDEVEGAAGYFLYDYDPDTGKYSIIKTLWEPGYLDKNVEVGKTYHYVVFAFVGIDGSTYSGEQSVVISIKYEVPLLEDPVLKELTLTEEGVKVEWEPVEGATGYYIGFYAEDGDTTARGFKKIAGGSVNSAIVEYASRTPGKMIYYYVIAYDSWGSSGSSNVERIGIPLPDLPPIPKIAAPKVSARCFREKRDNRTDDYGIELTWEPVEGADGYNVYFVENGKVLYSRPLKRCMDWYYYPKEHEIYSFYVEAYGHMEDGRSYKSDISEIEIEFIMPPEIPEPEPEPEPVVVLETPKITGLRCTSEGVEITWEPVEGAEGYYIRGRNADTEFGFQWILEGHDTVRYVDKMIKEGETYIYSVIAYAHTPLLTLSQESEGKSMVFIKPAGTMDPDDPDPNPDPDPNDPDPDDPDPDDPDPYDPDPDDPNPNPVPVPSVKLGDVDGDGKIDSKDALAVLKASVGIQQSVFIEEAADVNKDTKIDSKDALMILKHSVGLLVIQ